MKYSLFAVVLGAMFLVACDEKPAQYPPSLYEEREGMLSDEELESSKQNSAEKESQGQAENQSTDDGTKSGADADKKDSWGLLSEEIAEESDSSDDDAEQPSPSEVEDDENDSWGVLSEEASD